MYLPASSSLLFSGRKNRTKRTLAVGRPDPEAEAIVRRDLAKKAEDELKQQARLDSDRWVRSQGITPSSVSGSNPTPKNPPGKTRKENNTETQAQTTQTPTEVLEPSAPIAPQMEEARQPSFRTPIERKIPQTPTETPKPAVPVTVPQAEEANQQAIRTSIERKASQTPTEASEPAVPITVSARNAPQAEEANQQTIRTSIERNFLKLDELNNIFDQIFKLEKELEQLQTEKRDPKKAMKAAKKIEQKLIALKNRGPQISDTSPHPNPLDDVD